MVETSQSKAARRKKRRRTDKLWVKRPKYVKTAPTLLWAPIAHHGGFPAGRLPLHDPVPNHMWSDPGGKHELRRTLFCQEFRNEDRRKGKRDMHWLCMTGTGTYQRAAVSTNFCLLRGLSGRESQSTEKEEERQAEKKGSTLKHLHFSSS